MAGELYKIRKEVRDMKVKDTVYPRIFLTKEARIAGMNVGDKIDIVVYPNKIVIYKVDENSSIDKSE